MDPNPDLEKTRVGSEAAKESPEQSEQAGQSSMASQRASNLSADAPPFQLSTSHGSTQLSANAKEFVPRSFATPAATVPPSYMEQYQYVDEAAQYPVDQYAEDNGDPLMEYASQVLYEITCSPGQFTQFCDQLIGTLVSWPNLDQSTLMILADEIIAQAIREPNFRYNGARLCNAIARTFNGQGLPNFRGIILTRCKTIHNERKNLLQSDAEYLRGFALFMSELFVHLTPNEKAPERYRVLGRAVHELLVTLLDHPSPGNLKCICQILKLSGSYLEDDDREANKGNPFDMNKVMNIIETVARTVSMQMHIKDQLTNIVELRASDWGRAQGNVPANREVQPPILSVPPPQMGIHYGPDGVALTAEEAEFLDQSLNKQEEEEEYDYEDTGMDDEMAEAFEKFLMMKEALK